MFYLPSSLERKGDVMNPIKVSLEAAAIAGENEQGKRD